MSMQQRLKDEKWHQNKIEDAEMTNYRNEYYAYILPYDDGDMYEDYDYYNYQELEVVDEV